MKELEDLFAKAGMTITEFNTRSNKSADRLLEETEREVTIIWSENAQRIERVARSVAVALVTANGLWLREVGRVYPGTGKFIPGVRNTSISGTLRKNETHAQAAVREAEQELGISFSPDDFKFFGGEAYHWHESSAYHLVWSCTIAKIGVVTIPSVPASWKRNPVFVDEEKDVYCEWSPCKFPFMPQMEITNHESMMGIGLELGRHYGTFLADSERIQSLLSAIT